MKNLIVYSALAFVLFTMGCSKSPSVSSVTVVPPVITPVTVLTGAVPDYAMYTLSSLAGNKFMEVGGDGRQNQKFLDNTIIQENDPSYNNNLPNGWQEWYIIYKTTVNNVKYYEIMNVFSGKLLDVPGAVTTTATQLTQKTEISPLADEQLWSIQEVTSGKYSIINKGNGLAVTNAGPSATIVTSVTQASAANSTTQQWLLHTYAADTYRDDKLVNFFNRNNKTLGSVAFDEGASIPIAGGAVLWVTQDAFDGSSLTLANMFSCSSIFSYRNSVFVQPSVTNFDPNAAPNITRTGSAQNRPKQICDVEDGSSGYAWPANGVEINGHVYIQCGEGTGLGTGLRQSLYDLTESNTSTLWAVNRTLPPVMSTGPIGYAAGMVKDADGYVYAFGVLGVGFGYSSNLYVARFPVSNPQTWTFWDGSTWAATPSTATAAIIGTGLGTITVGYANGKYVLVSMNEGYNCTDEPRNIYTSVAATPTSGFNRTLTQVYSIDEYFAGQNARYYTPNIHSELVNGRNELSVTYCLNYSACSVSSCQNNTVDPYYYRVKGIRIPYSKIGL